MSLEILRFLRHEILTVEFHTIEKSRSINTEIPNLKLHILLPA